MAGRDVSAKERGGDLPVVVRLELTKAFHAKCWEEFIHSNQQKTEAKIIFIS